MSEHKYNDIEILAKLKKPLPTATREGRKGQVYEYIPTKYVSDRLIEVWGLSWSFEIISELVQNGHVAVKIRIHHPSEIGPQFKDAWGGAVYEEKIGLGDILKKATSLALKKAASLVGIDLQDPEDMLPITQDQKDIIISALKALGKSPNEEQLQMIAEMSTSAAEQTIEQLALQIKAAQ